MLCKKNHFVKRKENLKRTTLGLEAILVVVSSKLPSELGSIVLYCTSFILG